MKITTQELRDAKTIAITGDEPWLTDIYSSFCGRESPLTGNLSVRPEAYGLFPVEGKVDFTPLIECSRCQELLAYPIHRDIAVRFIDRIAAESDFEIEGDEGDETIERELDSQDLDTYYIGPNGEIDVEMVINDFIQTALPSRVTCSSVDRDCGLPVQNDKTGLVHKDKADFDTSPFAALKNLKLPDA